MIVTEFYNGQGLGNQLWCYAVTRVIAKKHGFAFGIKSREKFKGELFMNLDFGESVIGGNGPEGGPPITLPEGINNYYREATIFHPETQADVRVYDEHLINVSDNTKIDGVMQDENYISPYRQEITEWFKVSAEYNCLDFSSENICIINFRGGEYSRQKDLYLPEKYWENAIKNMRKINPSFRFVVVTDDPSSAKRFFPNFEVYHFNIGKDYSIVKNAHYLIMSNSSFGWFAAWTSETLRYCIAPKYWARHNVSDGYWSPGYAITSGWFYQDRTGKLFDANLCKAELKDYDSGLKIDTTQTYFPKIDFWNQIANKFKSLVPKSIRKAIRKITYENKR